MQRVLIAGVPRALARPRDRIEGSRAPFDIRQGSGSPWAPARRSFKPLRSMKTPGREQAAYRASHDPGLAHRARKLMLAQPAALLEVRVHRLNPSPGVTALCAGFELKRWREDQLVSHVMEWLPEFALKYGEWQGLGAHNAANLLSRAAKAVYTSQRYKSRGEFGEILLHIALRQVFKTVPAVSKYFFKDSSNDTVKGFDAVHVVATTRTLELWLGEVKFYEDIGKAISAVVAELSTHTGRNYLRSEFAAITNKIDDTWPQADRLRKLLHPNTSLDQVFDRICIPVLLTYNSPTVGAFKEASKAYKDALITEILRHHTSFASNTLPTDLRVHLFLLPLRDKKSLVKKLDQRLKQWQALV